MVVLRRTRLVSWKRSQFLWVCLGQQPFEFAVAQRTIERAADQPAVRLLSGMHNADEALHDRLAAVHLDFEHRLGRDRLGEKQTDAVRRYIVHDSEARWSTRGHRAANAHQPAATIARFRAFFRARVLRGGWVRHDASHIVCESADEIDWGVKA